jgi:hypothetical protein
MGPSLPANAEDGALPLGVSYGVAKNRPSVEHDDTLVRRSQEGMAMPRPMPS